MKMKDHATQIRKEFIRKDAGYLPAKLAAKRDICIDRLGVAYQHHHEYQPEKHPHHPRIGCRRSDEVIQRHATRAGVGLTESL